MESVLVLFYIPLGIGGSVVEFSPATREARVRFPADATLICRCFFLSFCNGHLINIMCVWVSSNVSAMHCVHDWMPFCVVS